MHTAEYNWVNKLINNDDFNIHLGHSFCECFINNEWILVDPTCRKIEKMYDPNIIELSYTVNGSKKFLPYFRGLDLGKKQTIKEHNEDMDIKCYEMFTKR